VDVSDAQAIADESQPIHSALRQQSAVAALGLRALQGKADLEDLFADACARLVAVLEVPFSSILELAPARTHLVLRAGCGWQDDLLGGHPSEVAISAGSQAGFTIASLEPVVVTDLRRETRFRPSPALVAHGVVSGMCVVVYVDGVPWGVLGAHTRRERRFAGHEADFLQAVANVLGAAIGRRRIELLLEARLEELRGSQAQHRALFEGAVDGILVTDDAGVIVDANRAAAELFRLERAALVGRVYDDLAAPSARDAVRTARDALRETGAHRGERPFRRDDGTVFVAEVADKASVLPGRHLSIVRDVTERRHLQQQLTQAQKVEAIGRLAGGIAHDFNNLLTAINGYAELVKRALDPRDPLFRQVDQIAKAGQRAAGLTRQLLAFSRKQVLEPRVLDVNGVVKNLEPMLRRIVGEDVEIETVLADDLSHVRADPEQLGQVLMNLVVNARDAMPRGGTLTIETRRVARIAIETRNVALGSDYVARRPEVSPGPYVLLAVTDTGTGMSPETLSHLFEPFFSTKGELGTGLGLATSYGIVRQSGGFIYAYSELGVGTTFKVYLPCTEAAPEVVAAPEAPAPGRGQGTILLVDDDETVREYVRTILENGGYDVLSAANGVEALFAVEKRQGPVDLVVTDVVMPKVSGLELRDRLLARWPDLKVLFVSGYPDEAIARHGLLEPTANFLSKPFSAQALLARVEKLLREKPIG
jgi:PAS domain S-box-containing protein